MRKIILLGSTGSIGTSSLDIISQFPGKLEVIGMSGGYNWELLMVQAKKYRPLKVAIMDQEGLGKLSRELSPLGIKVLYGIEGLMEIACDPGADTVINALSGGIGLLPTLRAIESGKDVAMANKEPIVMAGEILTRKAREMKVSILPIDSEPSAIWQCLRSGKRTEVKRLVITASGGPFRKTSAEDMKKVTVDQALSHPTWQMGKKVTIDSATMMNKGFEVIEIHHLFGMPVSDIDILVHPQSVVHSIVEFVDGSMVAQLSNPDMRLPIQHTLTYPERWPRESKGLDLAELGKFTFENPDLDRFPCIRAAYMAAEVGGTMPAVLSAADEVAVNAFLKGSISFVHIAQVVEKTLNSHSSMSVEDISAVFEAESWAQKFASEEVETISRA